MVLGEQIETFQGTAERILSMRTIIESPFMPTTEEIAKSVFSYEELVRQNIVYARLLLADSLEAGESPFASHLLYTQVWSEVRRDHGIRAALEWFDATEQVVFGTDLGFSSGMGRAYTKAKDIGLITCERRIWPEDKTIQQVRKLLHEEHLVDFAELVSRKSNGGKD